MAVSVGSFDSTAVRVNWFDEGITVAGEFDVVLITSAAVGVVTGVLATSAENSPTATGNGIATVTGVSATSAENSPSSNPNALPSGVSSISAENTSIGEPVALPSGVSSISAENAPASVGNGIASPTGDSTTSAENNLIGAPVSLPSGVSATSAEHSPLVAPNALLSGVSATSSENTSFAEPVALASGVACISAQNNPAGVGTGVGSPAGVSSTSVQNGPLGEPAAITIGVTSVSAENNPTATRGADGTAIPTGVSSISGENSPFGAPNAGAIGVSSVSIENNPTATGEQTGVASPPGVSIVSGINNPIAEVSVDGTALAFGVSGATTENLPEGLAFAAAAGVGAPSAFTNPSIPSILIATIPPIVNKIFENSQAAEVTVESSALTPWSIESSAPWLNASQVDSLHAFFSTRDSGLPNTGWNGRIAPGEYTAYIRITSGVNTLVVPVTHKVGYGDYLDIEYSFFEYPFAS